MIKKITPKEKRIITNENLHDMIVDSFDRFFVVMDENTKEIKSELTSLFRKEMAGLRSELKGDIYDLKKEMNQRFLIVDKKFVIIDDRLSGIDEKLSGVDDRLSDIDDKLSDIDDRLSIIEDGETHKHKLPKKFA